MWKSHQLIMLSINKKANVGEYAIMLNSVADRGGEKMKHSKFFKNIITSDK